MYIQYIGRIIQPCIYLLLLLIEMTGQAGLLKAKEPLHWN